MEQESAGASAGRGARRAGAAPAALVAVLVLLVAATFAGVARNGFVSFDDDVYLTANRHVGGGLTAASLRWAFTTTHGANWHPVTWLSHLADVTVFGMRPGAHHLVGLALHAANAALLFGLLAALTGRPWPAALAAALFALHPLRVEPVAWASERKELLAFLFALLAALAWLRGVRRGRPGAGAPALFALALMAKPSPVALPFLLLLLDWWPLGRWSPAGGPGGGRLLPPARLWLEKLPLFLLTAASSAVTLAVQSRGGALAFGDEIPFAGRAANALVAYAAYLGKALHPVDLAFFYPYPAAPRPGWLGAGALGLLIAITAAALRAARSRPWLAIGWLWYLGALVPAIGLVQVGAQAMADRYTYLPLAGIAVALAWSAAALAGRGPRLRAGVAALAAAALALLAGLAHRQVGTWRDDASLYAHALAVTRGNWVAHTGLGAVRHREGDRAGALAEFNAALAVRPGDPEALGDAGVVLLEEGRPGEALRLFERALAARPRDADRHYDRGNALAALGRAREAEAAFRAAVRIDPAHARGWNNLGSVLLAAGRREEAAAALREALRLEPGYARARANLDRARAGR